MRDLMFAFDRTYHKALHELLPQPLIHEKLSAQEWLEYLDWLWVLDTDSDLPNERRIDLVGTEYVLALPNAGMLTCYRVDGRMLFPAFDMARCLGYANPSATGSLCPHKELWRIAVPRRHSPNGRQSCQIVYKNFVPAEDALSLALRTAPSEESEIIKRIILLELEATK